MNCIRDSSYIGSCQECFWWSRLCEVPKLADEIFSAFAPRVTVVSRRKLKSNVESIGSMFYFHKILYIYVYIYLIYSS